MKRLISFILSLCILATGCAVNEEKEQTTLPTELISEERMESSQQISDAIYACLDEQLDSEAYEVEDISTVYLSKEYVEENLYNNLENNYFGYYLSDIDWSFEGEKYVFAPDGNGNTIVKEFEEYVSAFDQMIRNVAIGTGVILVCATLSIVTGAMGLTSLSVVLAYSAETAFVTSLETAAFTGIISSAVTAYQTHDFDKTCQAFLEAGSEGYKAGAIIGAVTGACIGTKEVYHAKHYIPTPQEAEQMALLEYPGEEQVSFLNGEVVPQNTTGASRPDIIRVVDDHLEAIEVKRYNLEKNLDQLVDQLYKQVGRRVVNLPEGSTQRIVLNVQGRGYTEPFLDNVITVVQDELYDIYPNIPVDIQGFIA